MSRKQISFMPGAELKKKLEKYAAKNGSSVSEVVVNALNEFFEDENFWDILFKRLNRNQDAFKKNEQKINILLEMFDLFIYYFFALTAEFSSEEERQLKDRAGVRHNKFFDSLCRQLQKNENFIERLNSKLEL